ncbi:MAG: His/Gly/Thr/Pro-type tRNA ligase C-terminal domain-containing protein, partial [Boseongicola sp.]|nr:His/Gly/Thr/Pro-type tRNA ligase C-terminal domain-containing protein [Boseongicola sp.]
NEKISYKVREHSVGKVPVILAVGHREVADGTVSVRKLGSKATETRSLAEAVRELASEALPPDLRRDDEMRSRDGTA